MVSCFSRVDELLQTHNLVRHGDPKDRFCFYQTGRSLSCCGSWHVLRLPCGNCACDLCVLGHVRLWCLRATHSLLPFWEHGCTVGIDRDPPVGGPPPRQNGGGYQSASSCCGFVEWIVDCVERVWNWEDKVRVTTPLYGEWGCNPRAIGFVHHLHESGRVLRFNR